MLRHLIISFAPHYLSSGSLTEGYKTKENFKIVAQKGGLLQEGIRNSHT